MATEGNVVTCAPDVLERELLHIANDGVRQPGFLTQDSVDQPPPGFFDFTQHSGKENPGSTDHHPRYEECLWKPKLFFDGRVGKLTVYNISTNEQSLTLWHPDSLSPFATISLPSRQGIEAPDYYGSDWGIEIRNEDESVCTLGESAQWTQGPQGGHWYLYVR